MNARGVETSLNLETLPSPRVLTHRVPRTYRTRVVLQCTSTLSRRAVSRSSACCSPGIASKQIEHSCSEAWSTCNCRCRLEISLVYPSPSGKTSARTEMPHRRQRHGDIAKRLVYLLHNHTVQVFQLAGKRPHRTCAGSVCQTCRCPDLTNSGGADPA